MLVCNVSLRPARAGITADIAEAVDATDATTTGNVVFATLVDDPASVGDIVDAYLGEIMVELASADAVADAGLSFAADVVEAVTAATTQDSTITAAGAVTWDAATVTAVTLSGGNLVATSTGTTSADQGAHVASTSGKTSGKYYFEITLTSLSASGAVGVNRSWGIGTTASTYTNMGNSATSGAVVYFSGNIWANGSNASRNIGSLSSGSVIGIAADLTNSRIWFRLAPSGLWNGSGSADPATNALGVTIPAGTMVPFCIFGGSGGVSGQVITANFGATSFTGTVPSGFTSGWPF